MNPLTDRCRAEDPWRRYLPWQGKIEVLLWCLAFFVPAIANTFVSHIEFVRDEKMVPLWQPALWEGSSALSSLVLLPPLLALCARWPLHADTWRLRLPGYVLASLLWSLLHVVGMVCLRKLGYVLVGERYDFGDWGRGLFYEYLKDARTFAVIVIADHGYRWFWRRLQGEVRLLDTPDGVPDTEPPERPDRFLVRKLGREFLVAANDIEWLQASGNYVNLRVRGHDYPLRSTIAGIEAKLDPARFVRIQRSYLVNLDQVVSIESLDTGDARVQLKDGTVLPCSRTYRGGLRERLGAAGTE